MASFSYAAHVRAETGQKRPLASAIGEDLTAASKRTAAPFSGTAALPDRGTNATLPVARWSYEAMQEGDVAFVNATASSGVKPGFFLQSVGMNTLNAMMRQEEYLLGDPLNLMKPTLARHSYVCNSGMYERSKPTKQFTDSTLETNHPARSFILEGVVCAKTDALNADEMIDVGGAEGVVAVGGLSALNVYNHSAMSKSRVLDHVYVVLMAKRVTRNNKWMLQYGLINSLHVWHGHVEKHFGSVVVLKVWQLGRIVDTNYARDRDDNKLLKLIVAIKPLIARAPNDEKTKGGMVPVDGDKTLEALVLPTSIEGRLEFYKERNEQIKQQEQCKDHISRKSFAALRMSPGLTTNQKLEIDKLNSQLDALRKQSQRSNEENALLKLRIQRLNSKGASGNDKADRITELERLLAEVRSAEDSLQEENSRIADELAFFLQTSQDYEAEIKDLKKKLADARDEIYALQQDIKRLEEELETLRGSPSEEVIALRKDLELTTKVKNNVTAELNALKSAGSSSSSGSSVPADNARIEELTRVVSTLEEEKQDLLQQLQSRQRLEEAEEYGDEGNPEALKAAAASFIQVLQYRNKGKLSKDENAASSRALLDFENRLAELTNQQLGQVNAAATWLTNSIDAKALSSFFIKNEYDKYVDDFVEASMKDKAFLSQRGIKANDEDRTTKIEQLRQSQVELSVQKKANADEKRALYSEILGYDTTEGIEGWRTNLKNNKVEESFLSALTLKIKNIGDKGKTPEQRINKLTQERKAAKELEEAREAKRLRDNEMLAKKAAEMRSHMRVYNEWKGVWQALYNNSAENAPKEYKNAWTNYETLKVLKFLAMDRTEAINSSKAFKAPDYSAFAFKRREEVRGLLYVFFLTPRDNSNKLELSAPVKEFLIPALNNKLEELDKKSPRPGPNNLNPDVDPDFVLPDWAKGYKPDANFKAATVSDLDATVETDDKRTGPTKEELEKEAKKIREIAKWALNNVFKGKAGQITDLPKDEWTEQDIAEKDREAFKRVGEKWERVIKQSGGSGDNQAKPQGGTPQPPSMKPPPMAPPAMKPPPMAPPAMVPPPMAPPAMVPPPMAPPAMVPPPNTPPPPPMPPP